MEGHGDLDVQLLGGRPSPFPEALGAFWVFWGSPSTLPGPTYSLHCNSFLGLPFGILNKELVKPKKGTTMETRGKP